MEFGQRTGLIGVIGDEDTVTGFILAGIGHRDKKNNTNYMIVDPEKATKEKVTEFFKSLVNRDDISIVLVNQYVAEMIRPAIDAHVAPIPTVLEIPSKEQPYDENKDPIMVRVNALLGSRNED